MLVRRQVLEELEDGQTESDQGRTGADPRHQRSFVGQAWAFHGKSSGRIKRLIGHEPSSTFVVVSIFPAVERSADGIAANNDQGGAGVGGPGPEGHAVYPSSMRRS
jgi:hypothetical protein